MTTLRDIILVARLKEVFISPASITALCKEALLGPQARVPCFAICCPIAYHSGPLLPALSQSLPTEALFLATFLPAS